MKKIWRTLPKSWFYSLAVILVTISLLFNPLAGTMPTSLAEGNESAVPQEEAEAGNLTDPSETVVEEPLVISVVQTIDITATSGTVTWVTDVLATSVVNYGNTTNLGLTASDVTLTTSHSVPLIELNPGTIYYYEVQSTDETGNITATDNNFGIYYSFTTLVPDTNPVEPEPLAPQERIEPQIATVVVNPDTEALLKSPREKITLSIPAGAVSERVRVELKELQPWTSTGMRIVNLFELDAYAVDRAGARVSQFQKELEITIKHDPEELNGLDISSLGLYCLEESSGQWIPVTASAYERETKVLTATIDHFSHYGELANPTISGPGHILAAQVGLHSGAATFSYPIEVPPGSGGFQPKIELTYDSGVADEMKNKKFVGSWVGIGWTLHLGRISYDEASDKYSIDFGDGAYRLVKDISDSTLYHTIPETFYKITRSGNTWTVLDRDGVTYQFGGTTDSQQYYYNADKAQNVYYRWDLNMIQDTHSQNTITIAYVQDICLDWLGHQNVRSAYPEHVRYNNDHVDIQFISSHDYTHAVGGPLRNDDPAGDVGGGYIYPPNVVENRKLDSIEIRLDGSLVRKYAFAYSTTPTFWAPDYGGCYYSGKHTLTSITQVGADGVSQLPTTTFSYSDKRIYLQSTFCEGYTGNPGNPAILNWPHLTQITNGYGATVSFTYAELPTPATQNIWTRNVVKSRTITPGVGPQQTYDYYYNYDVQGNDGSPEYFEPYPYGSAEQSEYRGFSKVKEKDAAGHYTVHYYYATGYAVGSASGEFLTGREYKTEWFDSANNLLEKEEYTWNYRFTAPALTHTPRNESAVFQDMNELATDSDGYIYFSFPPYNTIRKYDGWYNFVGGWGGTGSGPGQFNNPKGLAAYGNGDQIYIYVADTGNNRIQKFNKLGVYQTQWYSYYPWDVAVDDNGYVYVLDGNAQLKKYDSSGNYQNLTISALGGTTGIAVSSGGTYIYAVLETQNCVKIFDRYGNFLGQFGSYGGGNGQFNYPKGITIDSSNFLYVADTGNYRIEVFDGWGNFKGKCSVGGYSPWDLEMRFKTPGQYSELAIAGVPPTMCSPPHFVYLEKVEITIGSKISRTRYLYDNYGNVVTEYHDGDTSTNADDATVHRVFYPNTSARILNRPARERTYATITDDVGDANLRAETLYYYDNLAWGQPPTKGDLTRLEQKKDASTSVNTYYTYDNSYGNRLTETDPNNNTITYAYDTTYHALPVSKTYPTVNGLIMQEFYGWDYGSGKITSDTDVNGQVTTFEYDTFKRIVKVVKPGDSSASPTIQYQYNNWGTINQQHLKTLTKIAEGNYLWKSEYFDGVGRVVQTHAQGETGYTVIASTTTYNNRGLVDKEYVSQVLASGGVNGYYTPAGDWKYTTYAYDGLGRVTAQTGADGTTVSHDYSSPWKDLVTNQRGYKKGYYYDAFERLIKVEELDASHALYSTMTYGYDVLNNLAQVVDNSSNTSTMNYDWLSRKTSMTDPDMGSWSYGYDSNSNLTTQTDAKSQTISFGYDALNRLTGKTYPVGSGMTNVTYTYDSTVGGNYGKGQRTGMTDASGATAYKYDSRGRLIEEKRTIDSVDYTTQFTYDPADRLATVTYPTGETVIQTYNGRGFPYSLSGSVAGNIATSTLYNKLGQITEMNLNNGVKTTFGYWDVGGSYDTTGGYYGRLWEIQSSKGSKVRQDVKYTWDASGNLVSRQDVKFGGTESFTYDFLDRLTAVSSAYSHSYTYNAIGNILSMNGSSYTYGSSKPHAVTQVGSTSYSYDSNGNMINRGGTTITWDVENRPTAVGASTFVSDGDGNRLKKVEGGQTTIYVGKYYEKNLSTGTVTTYYYLGERLVALRSGSNLRYVHLDHLGSTNVVTDSSGSQSGYMRYFPYGSTRGSSGSLDTDKKFTGQRLDSTGLYYYGARYYDPVIGRFISADTIVPHPANPQSLNRYAYCLNNPLRYIDPSGHQEEWEYIMVPNIYATNPSDPTEAGLWYPTSNYASDTPGTIQSWGEGSIVWDQGGIPEYVPSGISGNIPTGGSMADVVASAGSATPTKTPTPPPVVTGCSFLCKLRKLGGYLWDAVEMGGGISLMTVAFVTEVTMTTVGGAIGSIAGPPGIIAGAGVGASLGFPIAYELGSLGWDFFAKGSNSIAGREVFQKAPIIPSVGH